MRLTLDTNIVASGLLWDGPPAQLIDAAQAGGVELFTYHRIRIVGARETLALIAKP